MYCIMNHEVCGIPGNESGVIQKSVNTEYPSKETKETECENNTYYRWHHQPVFIPGKLMMNTMNIILKLQLLFRPCIKMKQESMDEIFDKRKCYQPRRKHPKYIFKINLLAIKGINNTE